MASRPIQQGSAGYNSAGVPDGKRFQKRAALIVLILIIAIVAYFAIYGNNLLKSGKGGNVQSSTISTQNNSSTTLQTSIASTSLLVGSGPIAPGHATSTVAPTTSTTSTVSSGEGQCPCPNESQISAMLNYPPVGLVNVTFTSAYVSNGMEVAELQSQTSNGLSEPELGSISGGWVDSYRTKQGGTVLEIFDEHLIQTTEPEELAAAITPLIKAGNSTPSSGEADSMVYNYSISTIVGGKNILMVGYKGGYVVDLLIVAPANSSVAPVDAIARNISASLG